MVFDDVKNRHCAYFYSVTKLVSISELFFFMYWNVKYQNAVIYFSHLYFLHVCIFMHVENKLIYWIICFTHFLRAVLLWKNYRHPSCITLDNTQGLDCERSFFLPFLLLNCLSSIKNAHSKNNICKYTN